MTPPPDRRRLGRSSVSPTRRLDNRAAVSHTDHSSDDCDAWSLSNGTRAHPPLDGTLLTAARCLRTTCARPDRPPPSPSSCAPAERPAGSARAWAELMRLTVGIDVLTCAHCGARRTLLALVTCPSAARAILEHLGLPSSPPTPPPRRVPPRTAWTSRDHSPRRVPGPRTRKPNHPKDYRKDGLRRTRRRPAPGASQCAGDAGAGSRNNWDCQSHGPAPASSSVTRGPVAGMMTAISPTPESRACHEIPMIPCRSRTSRPAPDRQPCTNPASSSPAWASATSNWA